MARGAHMEYQPPTSLIDNIEARLALAQSAQNIIRKSDITLSEMEGVGIKQDAKDFRFNLIQLSAFLYADFSRLDRFVRQDNARRLIRGIAPVESFLAIFLQRDPRKIRQSEREHGDTDYDEEDAPHNEGGRATGSMYRDENERNKAFVRDNGECVFSQTCEPDVAHIWPFACNNTESRRENSLDCLLQLRVGMSMSLDYSLRGLFGEDSDELAPTDRAFNMITMCPQAHRYWSKAYFGLEWKGVVAEEPETYDTYTRFTVQWHWLPAHLPESFISQVSYQDTKKVDARRLVRLDSDTVVNSIVTALREATAEPYRLFTSKPASVRDGHGRQIESGRIFTLKVETKDLQNIKALIESAWLATRMAAFAGAAEEPYDLDRTCHIGLRLAGKLDQEMRRRAGWDE